MWTPSSLVQHKKLTLYANFHALLQKRRVLIFYSFKRRNYYCCSSWYGSLTVALKERLNVLQRKMIRFIHGLEYRAHVDGKNLKDLSWLSIPDRVRFFRMSHLFRVRHKLAPAYLMPNFKSISEAHSHNTRGSAHNFVLNRELSLSQTGFAFQAIKQWNDLPNDIKSIKVFRVFKRKLKEFFISQYD